MSLYIGNMLISHKAKYSIPYGFSLSEESTRQLEFGPTKVLPLVRPPVAGWPLTLQGLPASSRWAATFGASRYSMSNRRWPNDVITLYSWGKVQWLHLKPVNNQVYDYKNDCINYPVAIYLLTPRSTEGLHISVTIRNHFKKWFKLACWVPSFCLKLHYP